MTEGGSTGAATVQGAGTPARRPDWLGNPAVHVVALTLTKWADGLVNPKLVLAWLLAALGAPGAAIGALVPVREAGALLPQLALARLVERSAQRKRIWAAGSAVQGLAVIGMAMAALFLEGAAAGWTILAGLAVLALARAACSVSYKDTLARTVEKRRRGRLTGLATTLASVLVLGFAAALALGVLPLTIGTISAALLVSGACWLTGAMVFLFLQEQSQGDADGAEDDGSELSRLVSPVVNDAQLRLLIGARALLAVTALAPPFILLLSATGSADMRLGDLGPLLLASGIATILSGYLWGQLSDRSSRLTLVAGGLLGAVVFAAAAGLGLGGFDRLGTLAAAALIFVAQIAYEGVRAGRKLHLTDMTDDRRRARYTAISNTLIGLALLAGGLFGAAADMFGPAWVLAAFAVLALAGTAVALGLDEVQEG